MNTPYTKTILSLPLCILFCFVLPSTCLAQPSIDWDKTYGSNTWEELQAIAYTNDGGYLIAGATSATAPNGEVGLSGVGDGLTDAWVLKINQTGDIVWEGRYGCEGNDKIWDIYSEEDGTFLILVESASDSCATKSQNSRGGTDYWLIKTDDQGNRIWDRTYGGDENDFARKILKTDDGNFLLAGYSYSTDLVGERTIPSRGLTDFWVVKVTPDGDKIADYAYGGNDEDRLFNMMKKKDGTFILCGYSESDAGFEKSQNAFGRNDYWMMHIDENGQRIGPGDYMYGGSSLDVLKQVIETADGNLVLIGESFSEPNTGNKTAPHYGATEADEDFWIIKLNSDYSIDWQKSYGGDRQDFPHIAWQNRSGKLWIVGDSNSPASGNKTDDNIENSKDMWMLLLEPNGDKIWERSFGGSGQESPEEIILAHDGGYIIAGQSSSDQGYDKSEDNRGDAPSNDFWLFKTSCSIYDVDLEVETNVCNGEPFELDPTFESCEDCTYDWIDLDNDTIVVIVLTENTDFDVLVTDADGCEEQSVVHTIVQSDPKILEVEVIPTACVGDTDGSISILEIIDGVEPFEFSINEGEYYSRSDFTNLLPGEYNIVLQDAFGCLTDTSIVIPEPLPVLIDIGEDLLIEQGDSVFVDIITSAGVDTFVWAKPELVSCPDCLTAVLRPTETTLYSITATNDAGCEAKDLKLIAVKREFPYYAPTAFSPNNDGTNDFFLIFPGLAVEEIRNLQIYNRWGAQVFLSDTPGLNDVREGWNGLYRGKEAPTGVYLWSAEIEYIDGRIEQIKGDFTLLR